MNLWRDTILTKQVQVITMVHSLRLYLTFFLTGTVPNGCHDGSRLCLDWRNFSLFNGIFGLSEVRHVEFSTSVESDIPHSSYMCLWHVILEGCPFSVSPESTF